MIANQFERSVVDVQAVLDGLEDPDCRAMLRKLEEPMTTKELSNVCDIPLSTTYRKLDHLREASLIEDRVDLEPDGTQTTRHVVAFEEVRISLTEDRTIDVLIKRRPTSPDQRLSELWKRVREEGAAGRSRESASQ